MSLFLLFCCWRGEGEMMKNKWTSWHFSWSEILIELLTPAGCWLPPKLSKGGSGPSRLWPAQLFCENKIIEKILSSAKGDLTNHQDLCLGEDVKIFTLDKLEGRIEIEKIPNINIDDTRLASCRLQIVLLNPSEALFGNSQNCFMDKIDRFGSHLY